LRTSNAFVYLVLLFAASTDAKLVATSPIPESVEQGKTLTVRAIFDTPPDSVKGEFLGRSVTFFPLDSLTYRALTGVPVKSTPENHEFVVYSFGPPEGIENLNPVNMTASLTVTVLKADFERDTISLPKPLMSRLTSQNLTKEAKRLGPKFRTVSVHKMWKTQFLMPVQGTITSPFGAYRVYNDGKMSWPHKGVDIAAPEGDSILACADGVVILCEHMFIHGNTIMMDHGHGIVSVYCHLRDAAVKVDQRVRRGSFIGTIGQTGTATGPHLHWGLSVGNVRVDPVEWVERNID